MDEQQHNLRIWPGYETSIRYHEDKLLLGCEIVFKVLRGDTAMDVMNRVYNQGGNFKVRTNLSLSGLKEKDWKGGHQVTLFFLV